MDDGQEKLKNLLESDDSSMIQQGIKNLFSRFYGSTFFEDLDNHTLKDKYNELVSEYEELITQVGNNEIKREDLFDLAGPVHQLIQKFENFTIYKTRALTVTGDPTPILPFEKYHIANIWVKQGKDRMKENNEWISATKTRNYINQDPILDWLELYGDELEIQRDTAAPKYDVNLDFVQLLFRKGNEFEQTVVNYLIEKFGPDKFETVAQNYKDSRDSKKQDESSTKNNFIV